MSSNSFDLKSLSILRQAFNASEERANYLLEQLPLELAGTIRDRVAESTLDATTEQKMNLAIKNITLEFIGTQESKIRNKIYETFYHVCKPTTKNRNWGEQHIDDNGKIDQLLQSVEMS
ncbi:hypothetical protein EBR43_10615, partial [bacterium]|nr:hypothetical protein [bacterium]